MDTTDQPIPQTLRRQARRVAAAAVALAAAYAVVLAVAPERLWTGLAWRALRPDYAGVRLVQDNFDRSIYLRYGAWLRYRRVPYRDIASEYPQAATYLFGLPHLFAARPEGKRLAFSVMALTFWAALVAACAALLALDGKPPAAALLLALPAALYFSANRFDAIAAAWAACALLLLRLGRPCACMMFLALATLTKWYPAVFVPLVLAYARAQRGRWPWKEAGVFAGVLALFAGQTLCWAGLDGLLAPYRMQLAVKGNEESLFGLLRGVAPALADERVFLALQFSPFLLPLFVRVDAPRRLYDALALAAAVFMLFADFYSPQWLLWLSPLLILSARGAGDLWLAAAFDLATFAYFPLGYDLFGGTPAFEAILWAHAALRVWIVSRLARRAAWRRPRRQGA